MLFKIINKNMVVLDNNKSWHYSGLRGYGKIIFGLITLIASLYLLFNTYVSFFVLIVSLSFIVDGVFNLKGYRNKTYFLVYFVLIGLLGLITSYNILFIHFSNILDYFYILLFPFGLMYVISSYLGRNESQEMTWKDVW